MVVDCSPEALKLFSRQLGFVSHLAIQTVLLSELKAAARPDEMLSSFELVLTTATHFGEVTSCVPQLKDRVVQLVVSPSQETIINLAGIKPQQTLGVVCQSASFRAIIKARLESLLITNRTGDLEFPQGVAQLSTFVADKDVLIVPPDFTSLLDATSVPVIAEFTEGGGRVISFDYQIERGSLVYLDERIRGLLEP